MSAITADTWDLIKLVTRCTNRDGDIIHLPEPEYGILEQSPRFLKAVEIVVQERNSRWFSDLQMEWAKKQNKD